MATTPTSWYGGDVSVQATEGQIKEKPHQEIQPVGSPRQEPATFNATVEEEARETSRRGMNETDPQQASNDKNTTQPLTHTADNASGGRQGVTNDTQAPGPPLNAPTAPRSFGWDVAGRGGIPANAPRGPRSFYVGAIRGDGPAAQAAGNGVPPNAPTGPRAMMYRSNANPYPVVKRDLRC